MDTSKYKNNDGKTQVICCRTFYNDELLPVGPPEKEGNEIKASEYVFPNKFLLYIPFCSLTVMKRDHYILWKDENINNMYIEFLKELSRKMEVNVYTKKNVNNALKIIQNKKYARVKLITSGGDDNNLSGKKLIEQARKITHSNFVCLVFSDSNSHMEWICEMENVLFTSDPNDFKKFVALNMNLNDVLAFTSQLKNKYETDKYKFRINELELLNFPLR